MSTTDVIMLLVGLLGSLIVVAAGVLWQLKKNVTAWIKFISSLGLRKKEIDDKDFLFYRIIGIIYIVIGILVIGLQILALLNSPIIYKFWALFY